MTRRGDAASTPARRRRARAAVAAGLAVAAGATLAACGSSGGTSTAGKPPAAGLISASRCAANRAAGTITYLSGFQWTATVGTVDVAAAAANGWYHDLCLDVSLHAGSGDPAVATSTVASGRTTITEVGGAADAVTAAAGGVPTLAVATYGNVPIITLITMATTTDLHQLEGQTLGYKGQMPPQITAMLDKAGVDVAKVHEVGVGYDPTILPRGQVQALTGYKSNEVPTLKAGGFDVREWDPDAFGIGGTFNTLVANKAFAAAHPQALEDFLRTTFHAYDWCHTNLQSCLADEAKLSTGGQFDPTVEARRFRIESGLVDAHLLPGQGVGAESVAQFTPEADLLAADKLIPAVPDLSALVAPQYVAAVEHDGKVVWPAP
ncbi:MAG TPA: ABC transporter substrate-binding protein [Acidimicrobiales bacterium]|nr:ABC transporter substrate-binding protein [Acidimicrobiales bacterium]